MKLKEDGTVAPIGNYTTMFCAAASYCCIIVLPDYCFASTAHFVYLQASIGHFEAMSLPTRVPELLTT